MTTTENTSDRTTLDILESQANAEIAYLKGSLAAKFRRLTATAEEMRREIVDGELFASVHLTKEAAEIDLLYTRLKYATDWLANIETVKAETK